MLGFNAVDKIKAVQVREKPVGILGNFEHPLAFNLSYNLASAAFANAAYHLFVGKHAFAGGTPVNRHLFFVGKTLFVKLQKDPLGPLIILRVGGVYLARPVKREAQTFKLALKVLDVVFGYCFGVNMVFNGEVFGGKTKGVPTHGVQNVIAAKPLFAGDNIKRGVRTGVPDVKPLPRRIGKLHQRVIFFFVAVVLRGKALGFIPDVLPLFFNRFKIVTHYFSPLCYCINCEISAGSPSLHSFSSS